MNEIKNPDIQVIENKLQKIKEHIARYKGRSLYKPTRDRLKGVLEELDECSVLLSEILNEDSENTAETSITYERVYDEYCNQNDTFPKREFDSDLFDTFTDNESSSITQLDTYSSKFIVSTYRRRIELCSSTRIGIIQINQFLTLLNSWFSTRYSSSSINSGFRYKASRIHEWIDLIILASGYALHNKTFPMFKDKFDGWISTINTSSDRNWILPQDVMKFKNATSSDYTEEAILIERILKKSLYDSQFYPDLKDSVEKIVINSEKFGSDRKTTLELLESCKSNLIVTSSFEPDKF